MPRTGAFPNVVQQANTATDSSDKTFTVPAGKAWLVKSVSATLSCTTAAGNRQLDVHVKDASDNLLHIVKAGAVLVSSATGTVVFAPAHPQETAFTGGVMLRALADNLVIPAGYKVRVLDSAAIAATADDLTVRLLVEELAE